MNCIYVVDKYMFLFLYSVKSSYPEESGYVDKRKKELDKLWKDLKVGNHSTLTHLCFM